VTVVCVIGSIVVGIVVGIALVDISSGIVDVGCLFWGMCFHMPFQSTFI
jgi:hypothetical protein